MKNGAVVVAAMVAALAAAGTVTARDKEPKASDVQALLGEALGGAKVDADAAAAITKWILSEKDDTVARGLADVLRSKELAPRGSDRELWTATAESMAALFESGLGDAAAHRRRGAGDWPELAALLNAAAPAIADALRETSPSDRETMSRVLGALAPTAAPMVPSLVEGLHHARPEVRLGAAMALGAMGPAARRAAPELRRILDDSDPDVRAAAADALRRIETR